MLIKINGVINLYSFLPAYLNIHESSVVGARVVLPGTDEILNFLTMPRCAQAPSVYTVHYLYDKCPSHSRSVFLALC